MSRTGLMLLALGGFLGVAIRIWRPRIWFCRDIVAVCGIENIEPECTIFGAPVTFSTPMTVMVATSIGLMLFSLSVAIVLHLYLVTFVDVLQKLKPVVPN